ncbi:MAG: tyrosine-type recombinase/integrase, partial [Nakamurella sp.]
GLRHTGATWLADAGVPLHEILGHQSLETTRGYLHADYRHLAAAASLGSTFLTDQSPASPQPVSPARRCDPCDERKLPLTCGN